jgi:O-antigen/teichoic acid export membrane protein
MISIAGQGLYYGTAIGLGAVANFAISTYLIARLGVAEYASLALAEAILFLLAIVSGAGLNISLISELASDSGKSRGVIKTTALLLATALGTGMGAISYAIFAALENYATLPHVLIALVCALCFTEATGASCLAILRAESRAKHYLFASLFQSAIAIAVTVLLIDVYEFGVAAALAGRFLGTLALVFAVALPVFARSTALFDAGVARTLLRIGLPLVPATLSATWLNYSPRLILAGFVSAEVLGVFAFTTRVASLLALILVQPLSLLWHPVMFAKGSSPEAFAWFYPRALTSYVAVSGLVLGLAVSATSLLKTVMEHVLLPFSEPVFVLAAVAVLCQGILIMLNVGPYLKRKTHSVIPAYLVAACASTMLVAVLSFKFAETGAAAGSLISACLLCVLVWKTSQSLYRVQSNIRRLIRIIVVAAASAAIALGLQWFFGYRPLLAAATCLLFVILFGVGMFVAGPMSLGQVHHLIQSLTGNRERSA